MASVVFARAMKGARVFEIAWGSCVACIINILAIALFMSKGSNLCPTFTQVSKAIKGQHWCLAKGMGTIVAQYGHLRLAEAVYTRNYGWPYYTVQILLFKG